MTLNELIEALQDIALEDELNGERDVRLVEHKPSESPHHPGTYRATDAGRELAAKETTR